MILVDALRHYPRCPLPVKDWCHMVTDVALDELHAMARTIGIPEAAFQGDHYDLTPYRRALAVELGAVEVPSKELVIRMIPNRMNRRG
jgi:hypothetical protein